MLRLIDAQARAGRPRDAAATLALYLSQNPQSLAGQRLLGHLQLEAGEMDAAIETLEGVRRRVGNADVALLVDLALAYAGDGDDDDGGADVALRYARAAYALAPMNARAADAYAVALAATGQIDGARQLAAKARTLAPTDPVVAAHAREIG
jgi:Flp pilus assembly protein TadD